MLIPFTHVTRMTFRQSNAESNSMVFEMRSQESAMAGRFNCLETAAEPVSIEIYNCVGKEPRSFSTCSASGCCPFETRNVEMFRRWHSSMNSPN